jgi:hypothetical protein
MATANASGAYSMSLPAQVSYPSTFYVEVFSPNMITAHEELTVSNVGNNSIRTIGLTTPSNDEATWLEQVNSDRKTWGAPPLVFDETTEEIARLWVTWMAQGHFEHSCSGEVGCPDKTAYLTTEQPDFTATGENIGAGETSYSAVEGDFMSESANCPQPTDPSTCPFMENTGHFLNIVTPGLLWIGLAENLSGTNFEGSGTTPYYDQEFSYANEAGNTINVRAFRTSVLRP